MYALVALGFVVLIFKASGIFNYAQGVMALFAAMTLVGIQQGRVPFGHLINEIFGTDIHYFGWEVPALAAILLTVLVMIAFAYLVQRFVFRISWGRSRSSCSWPRSGWPISSKAFRT
jgi:branched-chain amino acid transport system permease protein